jgi:hypothetical protein
MVANQELTVARSIKETLQLIVQRTIYDDL